MRPFVRIGAFKFYKQKTCVENIKFVYRNVYRKTPWISVGFNSFADGLLRTVVNRIHAVTPSQGEVFKASSDNNLNVSVAVNHVLDSCLSRRCEQPSAECVTPSDGVAHVSGVFGSKCHANGVFLALILKIEGIDEVPDGSVFSYIRRIVAWTYGVVTFFLASNCSTASAERGRATSA